MRAYYDPVLDRLVLLSVRGKIVTLAQNTVFNLPWLGFRDGQTSGQTPAGLGTYRLLTGTPVPAGAEHGPFPEPVPFSYPMTGRDASFVGPPMPVTLDVLDADLASSWIIEGSPSGKHLSDWRAIGDVNGDGRQDVMLVSSTRAYVLLGDVEIRGSVESIREVASYEVDLTTVDDLVFFNEGSDLYRTDGTAGGTKLARALADPKMTATGTMKTLVVNGQHAAAFQPDTG